MGWAAPFTALNARGWGRRGKMVCLCMCESVCACVNVCGGGHTVLRME